MGKQKVWVTLSFENERQPDSVVLKGEWDNWSSLKMKKKKDGSFYLRKKISPGEWQFGFLVDHKEWEVQRSYKVVDSPYGSLNNSILVEE